MLSGNSSPVNPTRDEILVESTDIQDGVDSGNGVGRTSLPRVLSENSNPAPLQTIVTGDQLPGPLAQEAPVDNLSANNVSQTGSPITLFQDGIPMPVAADPSVPDPTSVHSTPVSPISPASPVDGDTTGGGSTSPGGERRTGIRNTIPPGLFKHLSGHKSLSGLFTPMSEADTSPTGSIRGSTLSDDGHPQTSDPPAEKNAWEDVAMADLPGEVEAVSDAPDEVSSFINRQEIPRSSKDEEIVSGTQPLQASEDISIRSPVSGERIDSMVSDELVEEVSDIGVGDVDRDAEGEVDLEYAVDTDVASSRASEVPSPRQAKDIIQEPPKEEDFVVLARDGDTSHLALNNSAQPSTIFYDGEQEQLESSSAASLQLVDVVPRLADRLDAHSKQEGASGGPTDSGLHQSGTGDSADGVTSVLQLSNPQYVILLRCYAVFLVDDIEVSQKF